MITVGTRGPLSPAPSFGYSLQNVYWESCCGEKDSPIKQTVPVLNLILVPSKKVTDATMFSQPDFLIEAP